MNQVLTPALHGLFPDAAMQGFRVGTPLNEQSVWIAPGRTERCLVEGVDYSGADSDVQFPLWHVKAGRGGAAGGYHQDVNRFAPHKVRVQSFPMADGASRNVIRLEGNVDGLGAAELSRVIDPPIVWQPGAMLTYRLKSLFSSEGNYPIYFNFEVRGLPTFRAKKNEGVEVIGVHFQGTNLMSKWWLDAEDGADTSQQHFERQPHPLMRDTWYTTQIVLTATDMPNTWQTSIRVRSNRELIWKLDTDASNSPNRFSQLGMITFGIERERPIYGVVYVALAEVMTNVAFEN
jgi:hypothetical protein